MANVKVNHIIKLDKSSRSENESEQWTMKDEESMQRELSLLLSSAIESYASIRQEHDDLVRIRIMHGAVYS